MIVLRVVLGIVAVVATATPATAAEPLIEVKIRAPLPGQPCLGVVEIEADVLASAPIERVEVFLDGGRAAVLTAPPWRHSLELGDDNRGHLIEVVAVDRLGNSGRADVRTAAIPISGEYSVSLQQLYVTALRDGQRILDLGRDEFTVLDDGDRQTLVTFERGEVPFTAVLLIDTSVSMRGPRLEAASAGVMEFVSGMAELDRSSLLAFSDRVNGRTPFTNDANVFAAELDRVEPRGGTALLDHLFMAVKLLEQRQGRRVVILLSDGVDSHSALPLEAVIRKTRHSQALLYWIWLADPASAEFADGRLRTIYSTWRSSDEYREQHETLRRAVERSGGRVVPVASAAEIKPVFRDILAELREQYVLGYYPSNNRDDGKWHKVRVRVDRNDVDLRTHDGYVDF